MLHVISDKQLKRSMRKLKWITTTSNCHRKQ